MFQLFRRSPVQHAFAVTAAPGAIPVLAPQIVSRTLGTAALLRAAGLQRGERVLYCGDQGLPAFVAFWAAVAAGAVFVPIDPAYSDSQRRRVLETVCPRLVLHDEPARGRWQGLDPRIAAIHIGTVTDATGNASTPSFEPVDMPDDAPVACLLMGDPAATAVVISRQSLLHSAEILAAAFAWQPGERLLTTSDLHTAGGLCQAMVAAPLAGMHWHPVTRARGADLGVLLGMIDAVRPHRIVASPLLLRQINAAADWLPGALTATRALYCAGTESHMADVAEFYARHAIPVINHYGVAGAAALSLSQRLTGWDPTDASVGWPVDCEIRVVTADGDVVADGAVGALEIRPSFPADCLEAAAGAATRQADGWLRSGALALRVDGRITLVERIASGSGAKGMAWNLAPPPPRMAYRT